MTGRPVFGDFLDKAHGHLDTADRIHAAGHRQVDIQPVSHSLLRLLVLMRRYVQDAAPGWRPEPARGRRVLTAWARACTEAQEALSNAAACLNDQEVSTGRPDAAGSDLAWQLDAAAVALTTGRDLLQTHLTRGLRGERELRSEWGIAVTSPAVARAVLAEMRSLARQLAPLGAGLALAPGTRGTPEARQNLNAACQWLWILKSAVDAAQWQEPVRVSDLELLRAIPACAPVPRRLPARDESIAGLCQGVISSAERVRHLAWAASREPAWSPGLTVNSLRRVAATSTLTSHHCQILLDLLAAGPAGRGSADHAACLSRAVEAAGRTREGWLRVVYALDRVTTDTRLHLSPEAFASSDLALWTGRLVYADSGWTLASGPAHRARPPDSLVPGPGDIPLVVTTVHHACDTLTSLAYTQREQIRAAGAAQRILVTTRSLPEAMDIPRPFAPALPDRIDSLVTACEQTGHSAEQATAQVADVAADVRAPSRVLTAVRDAAGAGRHGGPGRDDGATRAAGAMDDQCFAGEHPELPGPVERTLHHLGITSPDLLQRGADIDRAGERLIIDAATSLGPWRARPAATTLSKSAGAAELVNHALASGDPSAAALLHGPASAQRQPPEAEP